MRRRLVQQGDKTHTKHPDREPNEHDVLSLRIIHAAQRPIECNKTRLAQCNLSIRAREATDLDLLRTVDGDGGYDMWFWEC